MKKIIHQTKLSSFILVLILSATLAALPVVSAHDPPRTYNTYAYITVSPNPIGVNQEAIVVFWIDKIPVSAAGVGGDRWTDYTLEITKPNGDIDELGPFTSDPTSSAYTLYTPDQVGTYTFEFSFPGQVGSLYHPITGVPGSDSPYIGDMFLGSSASVTVTVTEEQVEKIPDYPLPKEYWKRPVEGQNTAWYSILSNWLDTYYGNVQDNGIAPNSPHIMWTKYLQDGGVVGENYPTAG
jgi:hypothetical protein